LPVTVRVNTLKAGRDEIISELRNKNISFHVMPWFEDALILEGVSSKDCNDMDLIKAGKLYRQALSSMLPVVVLDPRPGERVLDLCAAPGSKTTQIAAAMQNRGEIIAVEAVKSRFYKLKSVCDLLGVENISFKVMDGRRYRCEEMFDRILVDAPCSSEGRFKSGDKESFGYWSTRKIKEMVQKQRGLLLNASRLLKPGGTLVYSTCTFAPEENEGIVDWVLKKSQHEIRPEAISIPGVTAYPCLKVWEAKEFSAASGNGLRVLPGKDMEGFFIIKFVK
jgi:16S rRNA (cytosine1407-C5)-methyltransferase